MSKKQGKIRGFEDIETYGGASRSRCEDELDPKTIEYRRIGGDIMATFFFLIALTKMFS